MSNIKNALECVSIKNQEYKVIPESFNISNNNPIFYPFSIKINKCSGNCNNINDPYARICVSDTVKNLNVKIFNLMALTYGTRLIEWHETCKCICGSHEKLFVAINKNGIKINVDVNVKKLIDKGVCDKGYIFNLSNCECECDKSCNIRHCLDYSKIVSVRKN